MTPVPHRWRGSSAVAVGALILAGLLVLTPVAADSQSAADQRYRPPVDAPVIDPFRPPAEPWGAGNRGLEYGTAPGTPIRAIGPGVVSFSGPVAGSLHLTITHPDGLRSSYSGVAALRRSVGDVVEGGDRVAVSAATLHLGVRDGDRYIDPAALWGEVVASGPVVLVPVEPDPPNSVLDQRRGFPLRALLHRLLEGVGLGPWVS